MSPQYNLKYSLKDFWSDFLRRTFDSPEQVSVFFEVRGPTAQNWWDAKNAPSGASTAQALLDTEKGPILRKILADGMGHGKHETYPKHIQVDTRF